MTHLNKLLPIGTALLLCYVIYLHVLFKQHVDSPKHIEIATVDVSELTRHFASLNVNNADNVSQDQVHAWLKDIDRDIQYLAESEGYIILNKHAVLSSNADIIDLTNILKGNN